MKQLLWKEWMEKRLIALVCPCFVLLYTVGTMLESRPPFIQHDVYNILPIAFFCCALSGILAGCDSFSSEIANGTLPFLTTLPISRARIWLAKLLVGLLTIVISCALIAVILAVTGMIFDLRREIIWQLPQESAEWLGVLITAFFCFTVALAVSPLVDRSLASAVISVGVCIGVACAFAYWGSLFPNNIRQFGLTSRTSEYVSTFVMIASIAAIFAAFLMASYRTVTRGGTLRTPSRFYLSGGVLIGWLTAGVVAYVAMMMLIQLV